MTWPFAYWDAIEELYWEPSLLGLKSVPKTEWTITEDQISIPRAHIGKSASIYTRSGSSAENLERLHRLEVPLNHLFQITFAIAPDSAIRNLLHAPLGVQDPDQIDRFGREVALRYPAFSDSTTTQQDGLFVGYHSIVGVELKLGARTSPEQALKYLALIVAEECLTGRRKQIGLLYITPHHNPVAVYSQLKAAPNGRLADGFIHTMEQTSIGKRLAKFVSENREHFVDAAHRLQLAQISWRSLATRAHAMAMEQDATSAGGETVRRLLLGFAEGINSHRGACDGQ